MDMLRIRTNLLSGEDRGLPLYVYTAGTEVQQPMFRMFGYSCHQVIVTLAGEGRFRLLDKDEWDIVTNKKALFIPEGLPHEYKSAGDEPWIVGFISFKGTAEAVRAWGFGDEAKLQPVEDTGSLFTYIEAIWENSGAAYDVWETSSQLHGFLTELRKQAYQEASSEGEPGRGSSSIRESALRHAVKFLRDDMHRKLSVADLAKQVGYSPKQLTRLFMQAYRTTPLQYLKQMRLETSALLLTEQPDMPVSRVAAQVGMEPVYFTRMFRRQYGVAPTGYRELTP